MREAGIEMNRVRHASAVISLAIAAQVAAADTITFTPANNTLGAITGSVSGSAVTGGTLDRGAGLEYSPFWGGPNDVSYSAQGFVSGYDIDDASAFVITLHVASGYEISLSAIETGIWRRASGPATFDATVEGDPFGAWSTDTNSSSSPSFRAVSFAGNSEWFTGDVTVLLRGFGASHNASLGIAGIADDLVLTFETRSTGGSGGGGSGGNPIPSPAAAMIGGLGLLGVAARRRR